jgi:hypothetical protein
MNRVQHAVQAIGVLALLLAATLAAEPLPIPAPDELRSVGTLDSIDLGARRFVLTSERGSESFDFDGATQFVADGQPIEPASLRPGDTLRVDWARRGDVSVATRVELVPPAPAPPAGPESRRVERFIAVL